MCTDIHYELLPIIEKNTSYMYGQYITYNPNNQNLPFVSTDLLLLMYKFSHVFGCFYLVL